MGEFKESEHPRDRDGKFTDKGKGNTKQQKITKALNTYANKRKSPNVTNQEWQALIKYVQFILLAQKPKLFILALLIYF